MPTPTAVSSVGDAYTIGGGTVRGSNLFHSFTRFNVPTSGSATFDGPATIENVLSRVTGTEASSIDGLISTRGGASPMPLANFYLINPNGVMFGPNAMLDVGGAFHASTADYIRLSDGTVFAAAPVPGEILTSAPPIAFGFLNSNPAAISIDGSQLVVDPGQTLSIVGGNIEMTNGAVLFAPGGLVQVISVASPGEVVPSAPDLGLSSFSRLGDVTLYGASGMLASGDFGLPGGTVVIRSGRLIIDEGSALIHDTLDVAGSPIGIDISTTDSIVLRNGALVQTTTSDAGAASGISIKTGSLSVSNDSAIQSLGFGAATAPSGAIDIQVANADVAGVVTSNAPLATSGPISIRASGVFTLTGPQGEIFTFTQNTVPGGPFAGDIVAQVGSLVLTDGARLHSGAASGSQSGRNVSITAADSISISGGAGIETVGFSSNGGNVAIVAPRLTLNSGYISTTTRGAGTAGDVRFDGNSLNVSNGGQIASSSGRGTPGRAGSMTVNASGTVVVSGIGPDATVGNLTGSAVANSGLLSTAGGSGNAGQIVVSTPSLMVADGGRISVATTAAGNAGTITAHAMTVALNSGGQITSSTAAFGAGGAITLNSSSVGITGANSGLFSTAGGTGNAGQILVAAPSLSVADGGRISASTSAGGNAGTITANVANVILNGGQITSSTTGGGAGGAINLRSTTGGITGVNGAGLRHGSGAAAPRALTGGPLDLDHR